MLRDLAARGAEIDQHGRAVLADDDVVGRDVAMQEVGTWMSSSASSSGAMMPVELVLARRPPERLEPPLEALALLEMQDHVAGVVGAEVAIDAHDVGMVELAQRLRFLQEAVEAPAIVARRNRCERGAGIDLAVAGSVVGREIFLDRDEARERRLLGEIGDAETARTEHALDPVVTGEHRARGQSEEVRHVSRLDDCTGHTKDERR